MGIIAALASAVGKGAASAAGGAGAASLALPAAEAVTAGAMTPAVFSAIPGALGGAAPAIGAESAFSFAPFLKGAKEGMGIYGALKKFFPPGVQATPLTLPRAGGGGSPGASPITQQLLQAARARVGQQDPTAAMIARLLQR